MAQTEMDWRMSLSLLAKNWAESKEQSDLRSAQSSASCCAQVALQRCLILRTSVKSLPYPVIHPWQRGHLYFAE
jgi:hypothetical protein